ncbi:hypothetical protein [Flexibacterium corallicola]|uniref:hypothetical protein n=1 Tax=Flexibacterium corallicola TaxID=3037259 RepID=UPI00286FA5C1|nr:hypothetical protein [Pseudovibrio sp. M1P-2-3]
MPFLTPVRRLVAAFLLLTFTLFSSEHVQAETGVGKRIFKECPVSREEGNIFALCATATCWTLDNVAYCKCDIMKKQSISLPYHYEEGGEKKDVCDLLKTGVNNGFTVSTYATPRQMETEYNPAIEKLGPPMATYTCLNSDEEPAGYSAQCDGGLCFLSTQEQSFPGLGQLQENEIICSCPVVPSPSEGFQMAGPWLCSPGDSNTDGTCCDKSYHDKLCSVNSVKSTGTEIVVGAPIGVAAFLSKKLDGQFPGINQCRFK